MNDDALKRLWQQQSVAMPTSPVDERIANVKKQMRRFDRTIFWRDAREYVACVFLIVWFGRALFRDNSPLTSLGAAIIVGSSIFIGAYLFLQKRRAGVVLPDSSIVECSRVELRKVDAQIRMLQSVAWWYLLPLLIGALLFFFGYGSPLGVNVGYAAFCIALNWYIWRLNERAVERTLLPLKRELLSTLEPDIFHDLQPKKTKPMLKLLILIAAVAACLGIARLANARENVPDLQSVEPQAVDAWLTKVAAKYKMPSLAVAVVSDGKILSTNVVGVRRLGGQETVSLDDKYHLGSITKSMTATVAAMLVEQGKISWTTTIADMFADLKGTIDTNYYSATLEQLLSQRGGVPGNPPPDLWRAAWKATGSPAEQRLAFIKGILSRPPEAKPGKKYIYSNQGYAIAGVMLERASKQTWEDLMQSMLFQPLAMTSAGFGAPATVGKVDQPWGHSAKFLSLTAVPPGKGDDNPLAISPAGAAHCSVGDLAKYAAFHLAGERGENKLLKTETFRKLHEDAGDEYGLGWVVTKRGWAKGKALMHSGSNTMFYAVVWIAPKRNFAVVVATNTGADEAFDGCDDVASAMIKQYLQ